MWMVSVLKCLRLSSLPVSMGLALEEANPTERAIEFYEILSKFDFMSSTPTLFNSAELTLAIIKLLLNHYS
jgi:hypothetical protein